MIYKFSSTLNGKLITTETPLLQQQGMILEFASKLRKKNSPFERKLEKLTV